MAVSNLVRKTLGGLNKINVPKSQLGGVGRIIGTSIEVGMGISSYSSARQSGDSVPNAIAQGIFTTAINSLIPTMRGNLLYMAMDMGSSFLWGSASGVADQQKQMKYTGSGYVGGSGVFNMTNAGYTMRQRALTKMQASGQQINTVLGNEARNYISSSRKVW